MIIPYSFKERKITMKTKINLLILLATILLFSFALTACESKTVIVNVENGENINGTTFGKDAMIEIGNGLWYDSTTRIVYWWNGYFDECRCDTAPSPYYAPNGLPYRYNPETNTFEEIEVK
jgi:hypothetical protein